MGTDIQKITQSVKPHITRQMKPYSNVIRPYEGQLPVLVYLQYWGKSGRFYPNTLKQSRDMQKIIQSVRPYISHQMKPFSWVKAI